MAKAKPRAISTSGARPLWPADGARVLANVANVTNAKRPIFILLALVVMFKWILPFLAELTPPGVDIHQIQAEAVKRAARVKDKCANVCDGMNCPAGWDTGTSPEDHCKCICVRKDPTKATAWDKDHNQAQFFDDTDEPKNGVNYKRADHYKKLGQTPEQSPSRLDGP
eukprot:CAMPEP_0119082906 /NCGR_PEP_ID=MMETSP1178-20130426/123492_1 /TAXON_ID=33656 /ORGANISM="unid sp, Strain CCMP2000" /LENGTH=167 /DNA_ID=CAMNT_0007065723 /DNA_START=55 /DNA_END=558 /DNA_ORIENTATION=+